MRSRFLFPLPLLLAACGQPLEPDLGDPAQYAFPAEIRYACGAWAPAPPVATFGLFDIHFGRSTSDTPDGPPSAENIRAIRRAGGVVVHRFNLAMVRAVVPVAAVPGLAVAGVLGVTDPAHTDVVVFVGFHSGVDEAAIVARGGTVIRSYPSLNAMLVRVPDDRLPGLRGDSRIRYVEWAQGSACFAG